MPVKLLLPQVDEADRKLLRDLLYNHVPESVLTEKPGVAELLLKLEHVGDGETYVRARRAAEPRVTQGKLAEELGVSRETVCRNFPRGGVRGRGGGSPSGAGGR